MERSAKVAALRTVIFACMTSAPDESVTVPDKDKLSDRTHAGAMAKRNMTIQSSNARRDSTLFSIGVSEVVPREINMIAISQRSMVYALQRRLSTTNLRIYLFFLA